MSPRQAVNRRPFYATPITNTEPEGHDMAPTAEQLERMLADPSKRREIAKRVAADRTRRRAGGEHPEVAALRREIEAGKRGEVDLAARVAHSQAYHALRSARNVGREGVSSELMTRAEYVNMLRVRTTVTNSTGAPNPQWFKDAVFNPAPGGRIYPLFRVREQTEAQIGVGEEGDDTTQTTGPKDYGTGLDQLDVKFTRQEQPDSRFGGFVRADKSVLADSQVLADAVEMILHRQIDRQLDHEVVDGDGSGTAQGKHFVGLAHASVPTFNATGIATWEALIQSAGAVRQADFDGPLSVVLNVVDAQALTVETTSTGAPVLADALQALALLGVTGYVFSNVLAAGTGYVGSFGEGATLYVRQPPTLAISGEDGSDFLLGQAVVLVDARMSLRVHFSSAFTQIVNIGS